MTISPIFEISGYATYSSYQHLLLLCQLLHLYCHVVHQGLYLYEHPSSDNASPLVPEALRSSSSHEGTCVVCFDLLRKCSEGICASDNTHKNSKNSPQETSNVTFTFFDCEDLVLENLIAPALLFLLMFFMDPTKPPTIDMFAYVMLHVLDANSHSLCPYTVGFYFPPLDSMLSPTVSHNLHHALNMGHYTVWPLHQLKGIFMYDNRDKVHFDGSLAQDWATYNRVFNTNFPEGRGVKVE